MVRKTFFIVALLLVLPVLCGANQKFKVEYFVTGMNITTNERVVGWLDGVMGESQVQGHVLDRGHHYAVVGQSDGKGLFVLRSLCCEYAVEVADEISASKITNRKTWQESWK